MFRLLEYYGRWQGFKSRTQQLPGWARFMLVIAAIPGVLLLSLSLLAVVVSILALLLLTVPVLRIVTLLSGNKGQQTVQRAGSSGFGPIPDGMEEVIDQPTTVVESPNEEPRTPRRQIEVKIVE